jgi:DNA-binding HxlR family transcriptional regulator
MLRSDYEDQNCGIAASLEVIGERWTLLIVRDALLGVRRFEDFQARLGISRTVLAARLSKLVEDGVMTRERYRSRPDRFEYLLTDRGLELWPVVTALADWGSRRLAPAKPPRAFKHSACGSPITTEVRCPECEVALAPEDVVSAPTPGSPLSRSEWLGDEPRKALERERPLLQSVRD